MLTTSPFEHVLPDLAARWTRPRPEGAAVRDPAHCRGCARFAAAFREPWQRLTARTMDRVRALPEFLTADAFLHYVPAYLAAAAASSRWGRDHFDAVIACLVPANRVPAEIAHDAARVGALTQDERDALAGAIEQVAERRRWPLGDAGHAAVAWLRSGALVAPQPPASAPNPDSTGAWDWIGVLRDEIEHTFVVDTVPTIEVVEDPRHCTDCRGAYRVLAGNAWNQIPASDLWPEKDALFVISAPAFAVYLATFLWVALETGVPGGELRSTVTFGLERVISLRDTEGSRLAHHWRALTPAQRVVVGHVLLGLAEQERRWKDPDADATAALGRRWIAEAQTDSDAGA